MKRAVLFDLGDVLVHLRFEQGLARFAARLGGTSTRDAAAVFLGEHALAFNAGRLDPARFLTRFVEALGGGPDAHALAGAAWCDVFEPWPEMEALAAEVIDLGHRAYLLSNTDPLHFAHLRRELGVLDRFAGFHLSYEVGLLKPDPAYFTEALRRFALTPAQCVFVDDREENVDAARALGIASFVHRGDVAQVRAFLHVQGVL